MGEGQPRRPCSFRVGSSASHDPSTSPGCADAGPSFDPKQAYDAYRSLYSGRILLGMQPPPEAWGGSRLSRAEARDLALYVKQRPGRGGAGAMLWHLGKDGEAPTAQAISTLVCRTLALANCSTQLPPHY